MAKNKHPITERVTDDRTTGAGERLDSSDLGTGGVIFHPVKHPEPDPVVSAAEREEAQRQAQFIGGMNTDLHAIDKKGRPIPTLAERIAAEGYEVAMHGPEEAARRAKARKRGR
jgi:hypothetical protein